MLGMHPRIRTLGEAQLLPWELQNNRQPCRCGKPMLECEFWTSILDDIPIGVGPYPIEFFREKQSGGRLVRRAYLRSVVNGRVPEAQQDAAAAYGAVNAAYFSVVHEALQADADEPIDWLVDASKDLYRLIWLQDSGLFRIKVIHITKDPRSFVYSVLSRTPHGVTKGNASEVTPAMVRSTSRFAARWLTQNSMGRRYLQAAGADFLHVTYEDLAGKTAATLAELGRFVGEDFSAVNPDEFRKSPSHAVSGNPMKRSRSKIVLDEKWKSALPASLQRLTWAITGRHAGVYGYEA
jgi:hypothetical protein